MNSRAGFGFGAVLLAALLAGPGCNDDDGDPHAAGGEGGGGHHADAALVCQVMGKLCHAADSGEGMTHECHEVGHVGDGEACEAAFDGCMSVCIESDSGTGGQGGAGGGSGAGTEQDPYCAALGELCHAADDEDGPTHECHELGHVNDAEACAASFDECAELCLAALDEAAP